MTVPTAFAKPTETLFQEDSTSPGMSFIALSVVTFSIPANLFQMNTLAPYSILTIRKLVKQAHLSIHFRFFISEITLKSAASIL